MLVVAEILVLLYGVTCRYLFHTPVVWSDELASVLFLWLAMLGSVIALCRNQHMRMTALVSKASPQIQAFLETLAVAAPILFLTMMIHPTVEFAIEEQFITTPALDMQNSWRAAALPVGMVMMLVVTLVRLTPRGRLASPACSGWHGGGDRRRDDCAAAAAQGFWQLQPADLFVGLVAMGVLSGVPIACSGWRRWAT